MPIRRSNAPTRLPDGHFVDLVDGRFSRTTAADLDALFDRLDADPHGDHLVLHFHGGLVSRSSAHTSGRVLFDTYRSAGTYPAFFIWNSDLIHSIAFNLDEIAKEKAFQRLVLRVGQIVLGKFAEARLPAGARTATGEVDLPTLKELPKDLESLEAELTAREAQLKPLPQDLDPITTVQDAQAERELQRDAVLRAEAQKIAAGLREPADVEAELGSRGASPVRGSTKTLMSAPILKEIAEETPEPGARSLGTLITLARYGAVVVRAVVARYRDGRDHGLYTTIVQEVLRALYLDNVGVIIWNMMKNDTRDAFGVDPSVHGATAFLQRLAQHWPENRRVTLVGHSTGAVYIGHLIEKADAVLAPDRKFDVVFLAAACSFSFLNQRLEVFRRRVRHLRCFGLSDAVERGYWEFPPIFKGSLLYIVAGLLEEDEVDMPLVGMERYYTGAWPYDRDDMRAVTQYLSPEMRVWAGYDADLGPGRRCTALKHGGIDDEDLATRESLEHILRSGF